MCSVLRQKGIDDMDAVVSLINVFSAAPIYDNVERLSMWVLTHIPPVLVVIAMWVRLMETQLDSFSGQSRYAVAVRDFLWFGFVLSAYFALGALVSYAFNTFYGLFSEKGSFSVVFSQMQALINEINLQERDGLSDSVMNLLTSPATGIAYLVYYVSLIAVVFFLVVMRLALGVGYGLVFVWGLTAIPMAMTSRIKLLRGWAIFCGGVLLWPIVEAILIWFFSPVITSAAQELTNGMFETESLEKAGVYMLYTVLNFLIAAVILAAPLIAGMLAANHSAMTSLVMPFAGAAMASTASMYKVSKPHVTGAVRDTTSAVRNSGVVQAAGEALESSARSVAGMGPSPKPAAAGATKTNYRFAGDMPSRTDASANGQGTGTKTKAAAAAAVPQWLQPVPGLPRPRN